MSRNDRALLRQTENGLYCAAGDFYVDPWRPVDRAVITHAHADHAYSGCGGYLASREAYTVLRARLGVGAAITSVGYGEATEINGVRVSLHPAGHILGSAQVRVEHRGEIWVVSGDYKTEPDPTCSAFEVVRCHSFISESTFGLPIYRWRPQDEVFDEIRNWWVGNQQAGKASVVFAYSLGKSQRVLAGLAGRGELPGPIFTHGAVENMTRAYREAGRTLPATARVSAAPPKSDWSKSLILAPPSAQGTPWMRRFGPSSSGFASGWMRIRGPRRRRAVDRGFVLSDHVDWPSLLATIEATGAETVWLTHGYSDVVAHWLRSHGKDAHVVATRFTGESDVEPEADRESSPDGEPAS